MLNQVPDSSLVEDAVIAALLNDPGLQQLAPDGVWWDKAGEDATRYVIVSLISEGDVPVFGGRGYEEYLLMVKAVMLNASSVDIRAVMQRFDALLDDPAALAISGYVFGGSWREARIHITEPDAVDPAIRWLHRGGHYRVQVGIPT